MPPVMPGYVHADVPHERTVQAAGYQYGCNSEVTGDVAPRGQLTSYIAHPWALNRYTMQIDTEWIEMPCGHDTRGADPACRGCVNRGEK